MKSGFKEQVMNSYKSIMTKLLLVLTLCVPAQPLFAFDGEMVLVQGQPPLTEKMVNQLIDFFEWALDGKFNSLQRAQFQRDRVSEWRKGQQSDIDTFLKILEVRSQVAALTEQQRAGIKQAVQDELLNTLRQQPNEPISRMLLEVHQAGQNTYAHNPEAAHSPVDSPALGRANTETGSAGSLTGEWRSTHLSSVNYYSPTTGSYAPPSGNLFELKIQADGSYVESGLIQSSMYSCTTSVFGYKTGVARVQGSHVILEEKSSKLTSKDNCNKSFNYEKNPPLKTTAYQWRIVKDEYGTKLILTDEKGAEYPYYRKTR
jgi:hypothetical protein